MSRVFSLYDLFTVGLALEIGGAALLVRATILSPMKILRENALWGSPSYRTVAATRNRTESFVGFCGLVVGFIVQVVGYVAYVAHNGHAAYGIKRAIFAAVFAVIAAPAWFSLGLYLNKIVFRPLLVRVARQRLGDEPLPFPRADSLVRWGTAAGYAAHPGEKVPQYLDRIFKVKQSVLPQVGGAFAPLDQVPERDWPNFQD
jgi:hypothetical protein